MIEFEEHYGSDDVFVVTKSCEHIADIYQDKDVWILGELYDSFPKLTSQELRQIADKLDVLNK